MGLRGSFWRCGCVAIGLLVLALIVVLLIIFAWFLRSGSPPAMRCSLGECPKSPMPVPSTSPTPSAPLRNLIAKPPKRYSPIPYPSSHWRNDSLLGASVHTASILADEALPPATVRTDKQATLTYALRSLEEDATLRQAAAPALLARLEGGASIDVFFDCSHCDEGDAQALPQKLRLYPRTFDNPVLRSMPVAFPFTPRLMQRASIAGGTIEPYVALIFRDGTRDLDRWAIPIKVLRPDDVAEVSHSMHPPLARRMSIASRYPSDTVRIDFRDLGQQVVVTVPKRYAAMGRSLAQQSERDDSVRVLNTTDDATQYVVETGTDNAEISNASHELLNQLTFVGRRVSFDPDASTQEADGCEIPIAILHKQAGLSQAISKCIAAQRSALRTTLFTREVQELLFNLARCASGPADVSEHPVLAVSGIPYSAIQLLPIDNPGDRPFTCQGELRPRAASASWPRDLSDNFLGLHIAVALTPTEIGEDANHDRPPRMQGSTLTAVYASDPADELSPLFDSFATFSSHPPQATVERDGDSFLSALFSQRNALQVITINTHGRREIALPGGVSIPDRLLFANNLQAEDPHFNIPSSVTVTASRLRQAFSTLRSASTPLTRRPTILLLACDMAPYSGAGSNIPYMFIRLGARDVIVTETAVNAAMAELFGRDLVPRLMRERLPSVALIQSRRTLFERDGSILPLMWADVEGQN